MSTSGGQVNRTEVSSAGGGNPPTPNPPFQPNVIHILMDDAGRLQLPGYDDYNSWPEGYPYPPTPWLDSKMADGIRGTKTRRSPRCSPHRAEEMSGRFAHVSPGHPFGTQVGEVPNAEYQPEGFPFLGLQAKHRPFPEVARTAGTNYKMGLFGKYHLYEYQGDNSDGLIADPLAPCSIGGWDIFERTTLSGSGGPSQGYYGYKWETVVRDPITGLSSITASGTDPGQTDPARIFNETHLFNRMTSWLTSILSEPDPAPFFLQWWTHMPHGLLPALEADIGPLDQLVTNNVNLGTPLDLYTGDFDIEACVGDLVNPGAAGQNAKSVDGETYVGGHTRLGVASGGLYGTAGQANVLWRRQYTMIKIFDKLCSLLEDWLNNTYHAAAANTVWIVDADNGIVSSDFTPILDVSGDGAAPLLGGLVDGVGHSFDVLPPTDDNTASGEPYHVAADAKGSCHDEGIASPLIIWGGMLPERVRGVDCSALINSVDNYATFLDILAPPVAPSDESGRQHWKDAIGATDLAKVDSVSFLPCFFDITATSREYAFAQVFGPASASVGQETWIERAVVNRAGWKLHRSLDLEPDTGPDIDEWNLYDLKVDPREKDTTLYAAAIADPTSEAGLQLDDLQAEYDRIIA